MPNVKIFADKDLLAARRSEIGAALEPLRRLLCNELKVAPSACQIAVLSVLGLADQALANVEIQYLANPERTPERIKAACLALRESLTKPLGILPAVRATPLDPASYVAVK